MQKRIFGVFTALALAVLSPAARADTKVSGDIIGRVVLEDGSPLPNAVVTLTGEGLIQKSIGSTTNSRGVFRFPSLSPGDYTVRVSQAGFATREIPATVSVGRTLELDVKMTMARASEEVIVQGETPLVNRESAEIGANFTAKTIQEIPNTRNFIDVVDTAAGVNDRGAYGAGANVDGFSFFGKGSASNSYQLNGVNVNSLTFGDTWVNPEYDTIQEVQIVGPGASAEFSNFTGASVNVITKKGTNEYHGSLTSFYTDSYLWSDNSGGIADLKPDDNKYTSDTSVTLGGPIVKEKLLFFGAFGYHTSSTISNLYYQNGSPDHKKDINYQIRLDFLLNQSNTISAMHNGQPIKDKDLGLLKNSLPEVGYSVDWVTNTEYLAWESVWGKSTLSELKFAAVNGHDFSIPNAPLTAVAVYDGTTGTYYNSDGYQREFTNRRYQANASGTHYLDNFLGGSHEIKAGVEYEHASADYNYITSGGATVYFFPIGGGQYYLEASVGYVAHQKNGYRRPGAFVQDTVRLGRKTTVTLGARYDNPSVVDDRTGKTLFKFDDWAPRLGVTYDFAGDGKTVAHVAAGRYYDHKVPTYGAPFYAGTGIAPTSLYVLITDVKPDPKDPNLFNEIVQPGNLSGTYYGGQGYPVIGHPKNPHSDEFNVGLERQLGSNFAVSASYILKRDTDWLVLRDIAPHQWVPFQWTDPYFGKTLTLYNDAAGLPYSLAVGNNDFYSMRHQLAILELRARPTAKLSITGSVAWQKDRGNIDNAYAILSLAGITDTDPNFTQNPFYLNQPLSSERTWQFKVLANYQLPWRFAVGLDYRWLSGRPWSAYALRYEVPNFNDQGVYYVYLENVNSRRARYENLLNLRLTKVVPIGRAEVTGYVDVLNAFNWDASRYGYVYGWPGQTYLISGQNAFGKPYALEAPREFRFGLRVGF